MDSPNNTTSKSMHNLTMTQLMTSRILTALSVSWVSPPTYTLRP